MNRVEKARQAFIEYATYIGSDALAEEQAILSIGREHLPECARAVLDGGEPTEDYWDWLRSQTEEAQAEHDRENAAGYER